MEELREGVFNRECTEQKQWHWKAKGALVTVFVSVWQHFVDAVRKVVQWYLGWLECKDKKFILNFVDIKELVGIWTGYCQSYNLERLI